MFINRMRQNKTINHIPIDALFNYLGITSLLICRKVGRNIIFSRDFGDYPHPKHNYRGRLIYHLELKTYALFLIRFNRLNSNFDHLLLDYIHNITTALNNKSRPNIKLDLSKTH